MANNVLAGFSGGGGGRPFEDRFPADDFEVSELRIWGGTFIDAIQVIWRKISDPTQVVLGVKHGGLGGQLDRPGGLSVLMGSGEYVTSIRGRFGTVVDSLTVHTNRQTFQKAGGDGGDGGEYVFTPSIDDGRTEIVGFAGRAGDQIDQIGVYFRARPLAA